MQLSKDSFSIFEKWIENAQELNESQRKLFESAVEKGLLSRSRPIIKNPLDTITSESLLDISSITFCLTESCNLRCKYCTYGDRWHSNKVISFETVKNILRITELNFAEEIVLGFYGGEPLLCLSLIKKTISYVKENFSNHKFFFNMTTNATLINDKVADYLIKNQINLLISLDGPKELHDTNRINSNNEGSYDKVINAINIIKKKSQEYFEGFVNFNMVISSPINVDSINSFLNNVFPLPLSRISVTLAEQPRSVKSEKFVYTSTDYEKLHELRLDMEQNYISGEVYRNPLAFLFFSKAMRKIVFRNRNDISNKPFVPAGQCRPGSHKLYVDVDGRFHICERVGHDHYIGDFQRNIDLKFVKKSLSSFYDYCKQHCKDCFAKRLCGICLSSAIENDSFDHEKLKKQCKTARKYVKKNIRSYVKILDKNSQAFVNAPGFIPQKSLN